MRQSCSGFDDVGDHVGDPEPPHTIDVSGLLAEHLKTTGAADIRDALRSGRTIRCGQSYSVRVTASLALHLATLKQCSALADGSSVPAGRKAHRTYADRITAGTRKK